MKCKMCGAELVLKNSLYVCEFCGSKFLEKEIDSLSDCNKSNNEFAIRGGILISYKGNERIVNIPDGVIAIGPEAFKNNLSISQISFSQSVEEIQNNAFEGCLNLKLILDYDNIHFFGVDCFRNSGLEEVKIGPAVLKLGKTCFSNMPNLRKVIYMPQKDIKLNRTFFNCPKLDMVETDKLYFFPSFHTSLEVRNNLNNTRPTFADAFPETPFIRKVKERYTQCFKDAVCPECGGHISKGLFHSKCDNCKIDYNN